MKNTQKQHKKFKKLAKKELNKELTEQEASDAENRLLELFKIFIEIDRKEKKLQAKLKDSPKGFPLSVNEVGKSCLVCSKYLDTQNSWYDVNGAKCLNCQRNLDNKVAPTIICKSPDVWFKDWQLKSDLGVHPTTAKRLRNEGKLIAREFTLKNDNVYFRAYLVEENKEFIKTVKWKSKYRTNPIMVDKDGPIF
jgi:hypothetical protein